MLRGCARVFVCCVSVCVMGCVFLSLMLSVVACVSELCLFCVSKLLFFYL